MRALVPVTALAVVLLAAAAPHADAAPASTNGNFVKPSSLAPEPHTGNSYGAPISPPILTRRTSTKHKKPPAVPQLHSSPLPGS
jgi:hypothetical protein